MAMVASVNSKVINPEFMEEHPVDEQHLLEEGMNQKDLIESSVDAQVPESAMDMPEERPSEPSIEEQATEAHPTDEHAMGEQYLLDEGMNQDERMEPSVDAQAPEEVTMDMPEERPSEPSTEEQVAEAHPTDEHAMNEHSNDQAMEAEAELNPHHL